MPKELDARNAAAVALTSGALAGLVAAVLSLIVPFGPDAPSVGVFPVFSNILEFGSILIGVLVGVEIIEAQVGKDLYNNVEVAVGSILLSVLGVLTVGLSVPPFNFTPLPLAVGATVFVEAFLISVFALTYARAVKL